MPNSKPAPRLVPPRAFPSSVRKPAAKAKVRLRHAFLVCSLFFFVLAPLCLVGWYLWERAADQYASNVGFSVRTEKTSSAIEILGGITELSGGSSSDTDILFSYLTSQELVRRVNDQVDLHAIWSNGLEEQDPIFTFDPEGTIEDLMAHWDRKVTIIYNSGGGLIDLRVLAFNPQDAQLIARTLLEECTRMINALSDIAQEDTIKYARDELGVAVERLKTARRILTQFRNRTQIVDPTIDTKNQMGLLVTLQQQLAASLIELDLLRDTTRDSDPRIAQAERRVFVIEKRIKSERSKLGIGTSGEEGDVFANLVGEYEGLIVDREFAETAYVTALAGFDGAQAAARKQSRYLAAHVRPTLAEKAEYPQRLNIFLLCAMFLCFAWTIMVLIFYSLRDRK
jgi:capsular polysaccharide transport system permease protein